MTLEELLRMQVDATDKDGKRIKITPDFIISVQDERDGKIRIIIHPIGHSGETLDRLVSGDILEEVQW